MIVKAQSTITSQQLAKLNMPQTDMSVAWTIAVVQMTAAPNFAGLKTLKMISKLPYWTYPRIAEVERCIFTHNFPTPQGARVFDTLSARELNA